MNYNSQALAIWDRFSAWFEAESPTHVFRVLEGVREIHVEEICSGDFKVFKFQQDLNGIGSIRQANFDSNPPSFIEIFPRGKLSITEADEMAKSILDILLNDQELKMTKKNGAECGTYAQKAKKDPTFIYATGPGMYR